MMKGRWWMLLVPAGLVLILAAGQGPSPAGKPAKPAAATPSAAGSGFVLCQGVYALCTRAMCSPIPGPEGGLEMNGAGLLSCKCSVQSGSSVGTKCQGPKDTPAGKLVFSRYSLIRSYTQCNNTRPWANCVDSPCLIDADDPLAATATCTCSAVKGSTSPYIATSDFYNPAACTTGIISSATTDQGNAIAQFYEAATHMDPYVTITILNPDAGK